MSTPAPIVTWPWWQDFLDRLGRQELETAAPIFLAITAAAGHVNIRAAVWALVGAAVFTALKFTLMQMAGITAPADGTLLVSIIDRAVPAFAGVLLGFLGDSWMSVLSMHWGDDLWAAGAAAGTAVITAYLIPPAVKVAARSGIRVVHA